MTQDEMISWKIVKTLTIENWTRIQKGCLGGDWNGGVSDNPGDICDDGSINMTTLDRGGPEEGMKIIDQDGVYFHLNSTHASIT